MKHPHTLIAVSSIAVLLSLTGCDRNEQHTAGQQLDTAIAKTDAAAAKAADATRVAGSNAAAELKEASAKAAQLTTQAAAKIEEHLEDAAITAKVTTGLAADKDLKASRIKVDTHNGVVTLKGPAPTPAARERATEIARNVKGVNSVNNQLSVQAG